VPFALQPFDRSKHIYRNDAFVELVKDAVRFFSGTPIRELPPSESFQGTGVYALYYTGRTGIYAKYGELNRLAYSHPIYVGKAVPKGWRQARTVDAQAPTSRELVSRLRQHSRSIELGAGVELPDFMCRFMIFEDAGSDMIGTIEAALIKLHRPLWNSALDGFGNHDPGRGRYNQAKSDWDVVHVGREWATRCQGKHNTLESIMSNINTHMNLLG
jgi:Eco29kI restriction endonuclease